MWGKNRTKTEKGGDVGRNGSPFDFQASRNYPSRTFHIPELEQSDRYDAFSLFLFLFHPPILSFKPPQRALVAVAYRENAWKDSRKRLWKGEGRMQLAWGYQNLKRALREMGNGGGLEGRRVRSVVAIVETIPNGWMRHEKRERKFLVCPRRHRPFDLIKNHLLSKLIRKATVNHLRGHSKRFLSVQLQRNPFVFLTAWLPFPRLNRTDSFYNVAAFWEFWEFDKWFLNPFQYLAIWIV